MRKFLLLLPAAALLLVQAPAFAAAPALTNKALWTWEDDYGNTFTKRTQIANDYFKFVVVQGAAVNPVPLSGEFIRIPFTVQNVGSLAMTAPLQLRAAFSNNWGTVTITTDAGTPKVIDANDTNAVIASAGPLASGAFAYYWLNIGLRTNLPEGTYGFLVTNSCAGPFPLSVRISNSFNSYQQAVQEISASDGVRTITNLDGTGLLGDLDVRIAVRFLNPPLSAWVYYDVGAAPTGSMPNGTTASNRRVPFVLQGSNGTAVIPLSDPEMRAGSKVEFIVVDDGRVFSYSGTNSYSYFVKQYASQPQETDKPVTVANNVGDFSRTPARVVYTVTRDGFVNITVYDLRGAVIRTVRNGAVEAGRHADLWDGRNESGVDVAEGLYFIRVETPEFGVTFKLLLVRR
jgi:hypothetical protein